MLDEQFEISEQRLPLLSHRVIDPLLDHPEKLDELCRYVTANPNSHHYLNKLLYRFASLQNKLSRTDYFARGPFLVWLHRSAY